jgi:hypothetical protein
LDSIPEPDVTFAHWNFQTLFWSFPVECHNTITYAAVSFLNHHYQFCSRKTLFERHLMTCTHHQILFG